MGLDVTTTLYSGLAAVAAVAEVVSTIKVLSVIFDQPIDAAKKRGMASNSTFPSLELELRGHDLLGSGFQKTFANSSGSNSASDYNLPGTATFWITIVYHDTVRNTKMKTMEAAIDKFLVGLHPKMNLAWVENFRVIHSYADETTLLTGDTLRTVSRRVITVNVRPLKSLLLA